MKIIIIEDEIPAAEKLERFLLKYDSSIEILKVLSGVSESVHWFKENSKQYDLVFMDIQLSDGISFDILDQISIDKPIIFTTAFDEYAIKAFEVNSIDYLLKPLNYGDLEDALKKLKNIRDSFSSNFELHKISKSIEQFKTKSRFLVKLGNHIHSIKTNEIAFFYAEGRIVFIITNENKKFILDYTLEDLIKTLDPKEFYRVNRTFIININSIEKVLVYSNSRLKICTQINSEKEIIVSREKVIKFKIWFEGN